MRICAALRISGKRRKVQVVVCTLYFSATVSVESKHRQIKDLMRNETRLTVTVNVNVHFYANNIN